MHLLQRTILLTRHPSQLLYQQQQAPAQHQPAYQQHQQPVAAYGAPGAQRSSPAMGNIYDPVQQQYPAHRQQAPSQPPYQQPTQQWSQGPSPGAVRRTPSPQPPPQPTTEDGSNILFYVKALYDYTATIDEEFDFQAGDIIAVTSTPEDGWWTGELLDEERRQRGRNVFPSNFVCLF
ncbi:hypothetical protein NMY22_g18014 [Coprinellus aureogranulatus]|nr:hypothetical protein NMY22_g18014 [Coprinellus aureogranulatus]